MNKSVIAVVLIILALPVILQADETTETLLLEVKSLEYEGDSQNSVMVSCDTLTLIMGTPIEAFCGNLSLDITYSGRNGDDLSIHLSHIPLPPKSSPHMNRLKSQIGIPYIVDSVLVKGEHVYKVLATPLKIDSMEINCRFTHKDEDVFLFDPSANFDIYFVPNSLGDIHWNGVRDHLEMELKRFNEIFSFTQPGKINFYLYPCDAPYYADFDGRDFGFHPAKNSIYYEYSHQNHGLAVEAVNLMKLYRYWGYSPKLMAVGAANLTEFHVFYAREYKNNEGLYPLEDMFVSKDFDNLDDVHKRRIQAASFIAWLSAKMPVDKFRNLYVQSTDLTLKEKLEEFSGMSMADIEADWLNFVDTASFQYGLYNFFAQRALIQRDMSEAIYLYEQALEEKPLDSAMLANIYNVYYMAGYYEKSADALHKLGEYVDESDVWLPIANMMFANGKIDSAQYYYNQYGDQRETFDEILNYKLGQLHYFMGDYDKSRESFTMLLDSGKSIPLKIDGHLHLGRIYKREGKSDSADTQFTLALNAAKNLLSQYPDNSLYNMRAGEAALYLGEAQAARDYLTHAEFVEMRPFYLGRAMLAMGMAYDLQNDRENARIYYNRVLKIPSAYLDRQAAEKHLDKPFSI
ncbi:MAG: tetratricopeptide repeat protein [candidate division Zixibacteria bacterium]|nr:tetratricopeptide repeat protein [candidate division Zixibacteria bacterium]